MIGLSTLVEMKSMPPKTMGTYSCCYANTTYNELFTYPWPKKCPNFFGNKSPNVSIVKIEKKERNNTRWVKFNK